jgi:ABC-2 type transport system ATP-binding protein
VSVLQVSDLEVRYGARTVVRGIGFALEAGEIFGLLGPNGAGKTTTLAAIEGLVHPSAGHVRILDVDPERDPRRARAYLGVQLQTTAFGPDLPVRAVVELYAALYGVPCTRDDARRWLADAGLADELGAPADRLSGGQRQRLGLLLATLHAPTVLLLDEPTVGLDPQARRDLWERVRAMRARGAAVLVTTHSMEEAAELADRIGILVSGQLVALGPPQTLVARYARDPRVTAVASGAPTLEDVFLALTGTKEVRAG